MTSDSSKRFFDDYYRRSNRLIEVTVKGGRRLTGVFVSYFHGNEQNHEPFITRWHLVDEADQQTSGIDALGVFLGETVNQRDILKITFLEDGSEFLFAT